jgi:hypothetical protein
MAGVMVLLALMLIFSTVIFQGWEDVLRRDNEAEMMFRAQEIVRAIVRYRAERGTTPAKLEELIEPGQRGQYYIRKLYEDPLVEDGRWGLLYVGPGGEVIDPNGEAFDATQAGLGDAALSGQTAALTREERAALARGRRSGRGGRGVDPRRFGGAGAMAGVESGMAGGRQLAGLQIAGVKSLSMDDPFRVYNGYFEYSQWHFTFVDLEKQKLPGQGGQPGAAAGRGGFNRPGGQNQGGARGQKNRRGGRGDRSRRGRR